MKDKAGALSSNLYGMPWQSYTAFIGAVRSFSVGIGGAVLCTALLAKKKGAPVWGSL